MTRLEHAPDAAAALMEEIGNRYLALAREGYLDLPESEAFREYFVRVSHTCVKTLRAACVVSLAKGQSWRERVVGLQIASVCAASRDSWSLKPVQSAELEAMVTDVAAFFRDELRLGKLTHALTARPALLFFTITRDSDAIKDFVDTDQFSQDAFDVYAAAYAGLDLIHSEAPSRDAFVRQAAEAEWYGLEGMADTQRRFAAAVKYWSEAYASQL